jgi:hypothetical protein
VQGREVRHRSGQEQSICRDGAAKESNLPSAGLRRPAGFEDRMGHQAPAAPARRLCVLQPVLQRALDGRVERVEALQGERLG